MQIRAETGNQIERRLGGPLITQLVWTQVPRGTDAERIEARWKRNRRKLMDAAVKNARRLFGRDDLG